MITFISSQVAVQRWRVQDASQLHEFSQGWYDAQGPRLWWFKTCCVVSLLFFQLKSQSLFSPLESGWVPGLLVTRSICG